MKFTLFTILCADIITVIPLICLIILRAKNDVFRPSARRKGEKM